MIISHEGKELKSSIHKTADELFINMSIDRKDVPMSNYGIIQNLSKDNYYDTILQLKMLIFDFLQYCEMYYVKLDDIKFDGNKFLALFSTEGQKLSISI